MAFLTNSPCFRNAETGLVVKTLSGHAAPVYGCCWSSADGGVRWAVSASYDETVRLWDIASGSCLRVLLGHSRWVRCCCFSEGGGGRTWVATGSRDQSVRVWQLREGDFADAHNESLDETLLPKSSFHLDAIETTRETEVESGCQLAHEGPLDDNNVGAELFPSAQRSTAARSVRGAAPAPASLMVGADVDAIRMENQKLRAAELDAERLKVSNLQVTCEDLKAFERSILESYHTGEQQAREEMGDEWKRIKDERALLDKDKEHAQRILSEANEAAREVRERMKESMHASMVSSNRAVMDESAERETKIAEMQRTQDRVTADLRQQLLAAEDRLKHTEEQLQEEARQHAEARDEVEQLRNELADGADMQLRDSLRVSDVIKRNLHKADAVPPGEVDGVFEVKDRHHQLLNKSLRHLQSSTRKAMSASFNSWHENAYETKAARMQGAKMMKRRIMFRQAAAFDRWSQVLSFSPASLPISFFLHLVDFTSAPQKRVAANCCSLVRAGSRSWSTSQANRRGNVRRSRQPGSNQARASARDCDADNRVAGEPGHQTATHGECSS